PAIFAERPRARRERGDQANAHRSHLPKPPSARSCRALAYSRTASNASLAFELPAIVEAMDRPEACPDFLRLVVRSGTIGQGIRCVRGCPASTTRNAPVLYANVTIRGCTD